MFLHNEEGELKSDKKLERKVVAGRMLGGCWDKNLTPGQP